jgi:hypothetical protein
MPACSMCHGTDVAEMCAQGRCYWEEMQREEQEREQRAEWERQQMEEHYEKHPHG